jgi:very-short-patch-repair endonuclease
MGMGTMTKSPADILLAKHLEELGLPFATEVRFHPQRLWRWDFAITDARIAIEIQGAIWAGRKGGHTGGFGAQRDMDKRNAGVMLGWRVLTFSTADVLKGRAKAFLQEHL